MNNAICTRNINLLYIFTACVNLVFLLPIILPFYKNQIGLTFHDFLIGESVFAAGMIVFDVPTGWIADRFGRKYTMTAGAAWYVVCLYLLMSATTFWETILAQGAIALAICLISGANSAFLYDTLLSAGREGEYRKHESRRFALQLYGCAAACVAGAYLYTIAPKLPFLFEMGFMAAGVLTTLFMTEPERHKHITPHHPLRDMRDTLVYVLAGHREIAIMIVLMTFTFATTKLVMWSLQAYTSLLGIPESYNGWIIAAVMLFGGLSGHFSHHLLPRLQGRDVLYAMLSILIVALLAGGLLQSIFGLVLLTAEAFVYGFAAPRVQESLNRMADSGRRATILSAANLTTSIGFIPFSQMVGLMTDHYGIADGLLFHAAVLAVGTAAVYLLTRPRVARTGGAVH